MDGINVGGKTAQKISGLALLVVGEPEVLNVLVESRPKVPCYPLADAARHVSLNVGTQRIEGGDCDCRKRRKLDDSHFMKPEVRVDEVLEPAVQRFAAPIRSNTIFRGQGSSKLAIPEPITPSSAMKSGLR